MEEKIEITGYWYFPANSEKSYSGTLFIDNGEIDLKLLDCSDLPKGRFTVHGVATNGKKITLYKCFATNQTRSFPGIPSVILTANYYFEGDHLNEESLLFESAYIKFTFLDKWLDVGGYEISSDSDFENDISVKYKLPEAIIFYEDEQVKFSFLFQYYSPLFTPTHDCQITQESLIQIEHKSTFSLDVFWGYVAAIKSFLTLAFFSEPNIEKLSFKKEETVFKTIYDGQNKSEPKPKSHRRHFLFDYKTIQAECSTIFCKWYELNKSIEPVMNILLEMFGTRNIISENKFLNVMQAIETFHRRTRNNKKEDDSSFQSKISEIISASPEDHKAWLKEKLLYSNEPNLKERLEELFSEIDTALIEHLFPNHNTLITQAKDTRNYYTHFGAHLEKKAVKNPELYFLTERFKLLLLILLLKETNVDEQKATKIIIDSSHFLFNNIIVT